MTSGGYSERVVVDERYVLRVPANLDPAAAAPLLCAGITTWSPLRRWRADPGKKVGVVGLVGLGHVDVRFARSLGAQVVLLTTPRSKVEDGLRLVAHEVVISNDEAAMARHRGSFDLIVDTVSTAHSIDALMALVALEGTPCLVGVPPTPRQVAAFSVILPRRSPTGSCIGGIAETQEMLDCCGEHGIVCDVERVRMDEISEAYERMLRSDVRYRFVIDMASLSSG